MHDVSSFMAALQYGDSFFPSGAVSFSWGIETLADKGSLAGAADVASFIVGQLHARWAGFDRAVLLAAHCAAGDTEAVKRIDALVEMQSPVSELRSASRRMGDALLSVCGRLGMAEATTYRALVKRGETQGHLTVMQGFLWSRAGLSKTAAEAASAHGFAVGLLGAAVRLGAITHIEAQRILLLVREEVMRIAARPAPALGEISAYGMESEIAIMHHARRDLRLFAN